MSRRKGIGQHRGSQAARSPQLVFNAAECGVHVRVIRLEPVSKRPPQHTGGCAGGAALHHVVLSVKKIGRITRIEGHRRETREWRKRRSCPLPTVAHNIVNTKSAGSSRVRANGIRIPMSEVEITVPLAWCFVSPRIQPLDVFFGSAVSSTMELLFGWQL